MTSITITTEQKNRLLEMCKALFPEFDEITLEIESQYDGSQGFIFFKDSSMSNIADAIHWFEFCMTHLISKISHWHWKNNTKFKVDPFTGSRTDPWFVLYAKLNGGEIKEHPIDYLYKEFKKLTMHITS